MEAISPSGASPSSWWAQTLNAVASRIETYSGSVFAASAAATQWAAKQSMPSEALVRTPDPAPAPSPSPVPSPAPAPAPAPPPAVQVHRVDFVAVTSSPWDSEPSDTVTNQTVGQVSLRYSGGPLGAGEHFEYSTDGSTWHAVSTVDTLNSTLTLQGLTLSASPNIAIRIVDAAGQATAILGRVSIVYDGQAPTAVWVHDLSTQAEQVLARSSEAGTAYLVKTGGAGALAVSSLADILAADDSLWNRLSLSAAQRYEALSLEGLQEGSYSLYAVDAGGNLSAAPGSVLTLVHQAPLAILSAGTASRQGSALVQSNQKGSAYLVKTGGVGATVQVERLQDILDADEALWNRTELTEANRAVSLSLAGLEDGVYRLYTVNAEGQLSAASAYSLTVSAIPTAQGFVMAGQAPFEPATLFRHKVLLDDAGIPTDGSASYEDYRDWYFRYEELNKVIWKVQGAGDVNGDGLDDLIVMPYFYDYWLVFRSYYAWVESAYLVFGKQGGAPIDLQEVSQGRGGFAITPSAFSLQFRTITNGFIARGVGDVNGDGLDDVAMIMPSSAPSVLGILGYVVFGKTDGAAVNLAEIEAGQGGFILDSAEGLSLENMAGAGDLNGDGLADVLVATFGPFEPGAVYVMYGKADGRRVVLSDIAAGQGGYAIHGVGGSFLTTLGFGLCKAGDVNGDGLDDLIVSTPNYTYIDHNGFCFVVFGKHNNEPMDLDQVRAGMGGFEIAGTGKYGALGLNAAGAGDVNGDGLADLLVGSEYRSYVLFGKADGAAVDEDALNQGIGGFLIEAGTSIPYSPGTSGVGDMNGDGLADLVVSDLEYSRTVYVVFGKTDTAAVRREDLERGLGGFAIHQDPLFVDDYLVAWAAGDVNGDGLADLILGTSNGQNSKQLFGASYVVFGKTDTASVRLSDLSGPQSGAAHLLDFHGSDGTDLWTGSAANEVALGGLGDDVLFGRGGADVLLGGAGKDVLVLNVSNVQALCTAGFSGGLQARADGGSGLDTLRLEGASMTLDLGAIGKMQYPTGSSRLSSIEHIDLSGLGNYTLKGLTLQDVIDMSSTNVFNSIQGWSGLDATVARHQWLVDGDSGDRVELAQPGDWLLAGQASHAGTDYHIYNHTAGHAQLLLAQSLTLGM